MMMLAVPVTDASSRSMYVPCSFSASILYTWRSSSALNAAPRFLKPRKWVSRRRRPILSPPGSATTALPKRPSSGPIVSTLPRSAEHLRTYSSLARKSRLSSSAWNVKSPLPLRVTFTPMSCNKRMRLLTSRMSGMLVILTGSDVSSTAAITSRASFLAPCGVMVPCSWCPPSIINDSISVVVYVLRRCVVYIYNVADLFSATLSSLVIACRCLCAVELERFEVELNLAVGIVGEV